MTKFTDNRFLRFVVMGGLNTVATYLIYLFLVGYMDYKIALSISFILGIIMAYVLNSRVVFGVSFSWHSLFKYPLVYLVQYSLAFVLLYLEVEQMGLDRRFAPLVNVVLLLPLTFLLNRWFLTAEGKQ